MEQAETQEVDNSEPPFPPVYESGDNFETAGDLKQEAADLKSNGDWEGGTYWITV